MFEDSLSIAKAQIRHRRFYPKAHNFIYVLIQIVSIKT